MLRIIQAGNSLPTSFLVDPKAEFEPGMLAQLKTVDGGIVCGVSDGTVPPVGVIDDVRGNINGEWVDTTKGSSKITVWFTPLRFQTDQFEKSEKYNPGDPLYVSENGLFTTKLNKICDQQIGTVITPPTSLSPALEVDYWGEIVKCKILSEICLERIRQDNKWGGPEHDDGHNSHDWVSFMVKHLGKAISTPWSPTYFRKQMVIVAALSVAAIEWIDRANEKLDRVNIKLTDHFNNKKS